MSRALPVLVLCGLAACTTTESNGIDIELYASTHQQDESADELLGPGGPADIIEMVVIQSDDPNGSQRKADLQVATRAGKVPSLETGEGLRIYVRGFFDNDGPKFYGASAPFDAPLQDATGVSVQVGRADCVGLNTSSRRHSRQGGTEDLEKQRVGHTVTELRDGRILVVGGAQIGPDGAPTVIEASIEIYDPATAQFFSFGQLNEPRAWHTSTRLAGNQVLIVGGVRGVGADGVTVSNTAAIIDVGGIVPSVTALAGPFDTGDERYRHAATRLDDGSVLIAGGLGPMGTPLDSVYRYFASGIADPGAGRFVQQGSMLEARSQHTLTGLARGNEPAVVAGGLGVDGPLASIEVFTINPNQGGCVNDQTPSPESGCWIRPTGRVLQRARFSHRAVRVGGSRKEKVLWVGGYASEDRSQLARELEMLDERLEVTSGGDTLEFGRGDLAAAELADGDVLVVGGRSGDAPQVVATRLRRREDPATRALVGFAADDVEPDCDMSEARYGHEAIRMTTGTVLIVGGVSLDGGGQPVASRRAEIYFPRVVDLSTVYPSPSF